jgi:hypothetical protein
VRRCALRCINTCATASPQLAAALQRAGMATTLQVQPATSWDSTLPMCSYLQNAFVALWKHAANFLLCCSQTLLAEGHFKSQELQQLAQMAAQRLGAATSHPSSQTR